FFLFLGYYISSCLALLVSVRKKVRRAPRRWPRAGGVCQLCEYDLAGLPAGAPCPECGVRFPTIARERLLVVHPVRLRQWWFTLIGLALGFLLPWPVAYVLLFPAYRAEGFSLEQALHCIPIRELGPNGQGPGLQMWPFMAAVAAAPLAILCGSP